jgi:dihydropteroate synthase
MFAQQRRKAAGTDPAAFRDLAPQVGLEPTTLRLTAECSAIELLRNVYRHRSRNAIRERTSFITKRSLAVKTSALEVVGQFEKWHGRPARESRARCACHNRTDQLPLFTFALFLSTFAFMPIRQWKLARRSLPYGERTLVMGVLNVTPDSFSDGGRFFSFDRALAHAERMIAEGADIIDVGGESARPGALPVAEEEELRRVIPVIERLTAKASVPISIDTTKSAVAQAALEAGAEIVNDISALRFDRLIADEAAKAKAGLVLMHSRGTPKTMQTLPPVDDIMSEVISGLRTSLAVAEERGVARESIAIDPGIGFGKTAEQNVELIAKLDQLVRDFSDFPILIGTSRKSFIGKLLDGAPADERLHGTIASLAACVVKGVHIVRVHDVKAAIEALRVVDAIMSE